MSRHLTPKEKVDIITRYEDELETMSNLAKEYGITRQGVYKILKKAAVDTSNNKIPVTCTACGGTILRSRSKIRKNYNHFCNYDCYFAYLEAGNGMGEYVSNRHGQRIARTVVSQHFELQQNHIVHHEDRNALNNRIDNLRVFANQGDHVRYHRFGPGYVMPIWDGSKI